MSDAGWLAEKTLMNSAADLRCDVLIRSQHEHDHAPTSEFLLSTSPRVIICGSDARQPEMQLPGSLIQHADAHQITLFDTWRDGSVELRFQKHELEVIPADKKQALTLKAQETK
jgi:beta-lactamase superfamily II metal-dependent hydrolase